MSDVSGAPDDGTDAAELITQIRQLAGADPAGVQQVVSDVLAALDRATGGALRDQLPEGLSLDLPEGLSLDAASPSAEAASDRSTSTS
ncbi:hypothetical protein AB0J86_24070 [Micromonospora sp. NPDC049559]|uniref:hypothetical protein n=1 Tax=Micromonospora sp. NPDC049559 TaxID=3155923 RepID=UPI00344046BB